MFTILLRYQCANADYPLIFAAENYRHFTWQHNLLSDIYRQNNHKIITIKGIWYNKE